MAQQGRTVDKETKKAIQDFLDNGGQITVCPPGQRSEEIEYTGGFYQKRKKKKEDEANKE